MKITNSYTTTVRTNHEQPLESNKKESTESTANNNNKTLESSTVQNTNIKQSKAEAVIPKEIQNIINALKNKVPLTNEVLQQITEFVTKSEGTMEQKLETLKMLLNKNLVLTQTHLKAIHQALHGKVNINETNLEKVLQQNTGQDISSSDHLTKNKTLVKALINQAREALSQGLSLDQVIQNSKNLLDQSKIVNRELFSKLKTTLSEVHQIKHGNEEFQANKNRQAQEILLNKLEVISLELENSHIEQESIEPDSNIKPITNDYQESINPIQLQSKDIIVNTITKRLAEATIQFRDIKREIVRNIDQIASQTSITSLTDKNTYQNVKSLLESAINKLDNAILKSDIVYLTDMKTEKTLMQASSRLAEARAHLENGNQPKATEILQEVKQTMDQLKWQPSDVKIKHFVAKESLFLEDNDINNWTIKHSEVVKSHYNHEGSARGMFELIRSQGLNHDSEIAQSLAFNKFDSQKEELQKNMKAVIMKVVETGAETKNPEARQAAENILQNITGQQLLSKFDSGSNMQSMFFNLPYSIGEKVENIKVYINSRKDGEKIDWENSSLYFLVETKKLGETGILVTSSNRNLSITIKNDHPAIQAKLENLVAKYKDRIHEIGYQIMGIHFKKLNENSLQNKSAEKNLSETKPAQPEFYNPSKKGYDFRV